MRQLKNQKAETEKTSSKPQNNKWLKSFSLYLFTKLIISIKYIFIISIYCIISRRIIFIAASNLCQVCIFKVNQRALQKHAQTSNWDMFSAQKFWRLSPTPKPSKLCWIWIARATIHLIKHSWGNYEKSKNTTKNIIAMLKLMSLQKKIMWTY